MLKLCVIRFEGAAPYAVALHLPGKFLTLERVVV